MKLTERSTLNAQRSTLNGAPVLSVERFSNSSRRAFTLIELMVVVILIAIMTAMIIPEMRGTYEDAILRSTGRKLVDLFNVANSRAITHNQLHRIRLDRKEGRYFLERKLREGETGFVAVRDVRGGEGTLDSRISLQLRKLDDDPSATPEGVAPLISQDETPDRSKDDAIVFYPDGTAESAEILLRDRQGFQMALRLNPTTARVHIVELPHQ